MRWLLVVIGVLLLTFSVNAQETITCPGAPASRLVVGQQARVMAEGGVNFRERPNTLAQLLNVIPQNTIIPIVEGPFCGEGYAWWAVDYEGQRGWVVEGTGEFYWMQPYLVQSAQVGTIRIETTPELTSSISYQRTAEAVEFYLPDVPNTLPQQKIFSAVRVIPLENIADNNYIELVNQILEQEDITLLMEFADYFAHVEFLELANGKGVRYLSIAVAPISSVRPEGFLYNFLGIADDWLVQTQQVVTLPDAIAQSLLPPAIDDYPAYLEQVQIRLNELAPEDFTPSLTLLDNLMLSLRTDAPLEQSDVVHFNYEDALQFDYNPILAYEIVTEIITDDSELPDHLRFNFAGYPLTGDAVLQVYQTDLVDNNWLVGLQQILTRQPGNPPRVPVLSRSAETALNIEEVAYLNTGMRALVTYDEDLFYTYQALSTDGGYYLSLLLPVNRTDDDFYPPLTILDMLVESLIVSVP